MQTNTMIFQKGSMSYRNQFSIMHFSLNCGFLAFPHLFLQKFTIFQGKKSLGQTAYLV